MMARFSIMAINYDKRFFLWAFIFVFYAVFSSPFPKNPGVVEIALGLLLVFSVLVISNLRNLYADFFVRRKPFCVVSLLIFLYFFVVPSFQFFIGPALINDYVRDLIPLAYLFLPLLIRNDPNVDNLKSFLLFGVIFIGLMYSFRYLFESGIRLDEIGSVVKFDNDGYYPFDPAVAFSMIYCLCHSIFDNLKGSHRILFFISGLICAMTLLGVAQRAPFGFLIISFCLLFFLKLNYIRFILLLIVSICLIILFEDNFRSIFSVLIEKQILHGDNNKIAEFLDVFYALNTSEKLIWGLGWGAMFDSTAYEGLASNTHSIISYFLVKSGFFGSVLLFIYMTFFLVYFFRVCQVDKVLALSLASSLLIGVLFQPTYKTFTYGLLLMILSRYAVQEISISARINEIQTKTSPL